MQPVLIIDTSYLCHRAFHSVGDLAFGDVGTGTVYGVFREILFLQDFFKTNRFVFACDAPGPSLRQRILPSYKSTRKARHSAETPAQKEARASFQEQVALLREDYLTAIGYQNVFIAPGYEADDIIARVALDLPDDEEGIIVGSDHDLWQCLRPNVWCWNPYKKKGYDYKTFKKDWGITPKRWASVKALAGCKSDDIPGLPGVGESTAAKWLRGALSPRTNAAKAMAASRVLYERNIELVRLPLKGTPHFTIRDDEVTVEKWNAIIDRLGMKSLHDEAPGTQNTKPRGVHKRGTKQKGFGLDSSRRA